MNHSLQSSSNDSNIDFEMVNIRGPVSAKHTKGGSMQGGDRKNPRFNRKLLCYLLPFIATKKTGYLITS